MSIAVGSTDTFLMCVIKRITNLPSLNHWATIWNVADSILDGVIARFHWNNPSCRTMARGLTQPLTEISTTDVSWGVKAVGPYGW
jgi:hypothetical protein